MLPAAILQIMPKRRGEWRLFLLALHRQIWPLPRRAKPRAAQAHNRNTEGHRRRHAYVGAVKAGRVISIHLRLDQWRHSGGLR